MHQSLARALAWRLSAVAIVLAGAFAVIGYVKEMADVDHMVGTMARQEMRQILADRMVDLEDPGLGPAVVGEITRELVSEHFLVAELYDPDGIKMAETVRPGAEFLAREIDTLRHNFPPADSMSSARLRRDGNLFLEVMVPILDHHHPGPPRLLGYFEGVYQVDPRTDRQIEESVAVTVSMAVLAVLLTALITYPVVLRLGRDVTAKADDLARSHRELAEVGAANRAMSEFLANMSHELRAPLNAIIGFSEVMDQQMFGPLGHERYRGYARDIHTSGHHLLELINDILDLSKVEAGRLELHAGPVDLAPLVETCHRLVAEQAERARVRLKVESHQAPARLVADARKVKQILLNLLTNAIKFTPEGGAVTLTITPAADGGVVLTVADTGVGIAAEDLPRVLTPFGQAAHDVNRVQEGTGLGLPLAKRLAELHGGRLDLASTVGVGTTVTVVLPDAREAACPASN